MLLIHATTTRVNRNSCFIHNLLWSGAPSSAKHFVSFMAPSRRMTSHQHRKTRFPRYPCGGLQIRRFLNFSSTSHSLTTPSSNQTQLVYRHSAQHQSREQDTARMTSLTHSQGRADACQETEFARGRPSNTCWLQACIRSASQRF